jgi:hypothetical protein
MKEELRFKKLCGFFRALQNRNENGDQFIAFIRSAPASLSATLAALPCMSLIPAAPFLTDRRQLVCGDNLFIDEQFKPVSGLLEFAQ